MMPFSQWLLMAIVVCLTAIFTKHSSARLSNGIILTRNISNPIFTACVIVLLAYFTGNTIANDVWIYRENFRYLDTDITWQDLYEMGTGSNPLFGFIQVLFKGLISEDPAAFHFFEGLIVQTCFVLFYRRYSPSLPMSLFMFISSGLFFFTMVSWKQSIAMSIGLLCVPLIQDKRYMAFAAVLLLAMLIHPYIIMYGMLPFLISDKVWTKKNILMIGVMFVAGMSLSAIIPSALEMTETVFGDRHDEQWFTDGHGISWQRIVFFAITPVLSWIYRDRLDTHPYPLMNGFIQMSVVSFGFYLMSMSGGANFISRMGTYFEPFTYVALPYILLCVVPRSSRALIKWGVLVLFLIFFAFLQLKRGSL